MFGQKSRKIRELANRVNDLQLKVEDARGTAGTNKFNLDRTLQRTELLESEVASLRARLTASLLLNMRLNNIARGAASGVGRAA